MSKLSELLKSHPVTAKQAADLAEEKGLRLRYGTIAAYWAGSRHGRPTLDTLTALAEVTGIPLTQLQDAAWDATAPLGKYDPPEEAALLNLRQRRALDELIKSFVVSNGASNEPVQPAHSGTSSEPGAPGESHETQEAGLTDDPEVPNRAVTAARGAARRARKASEIQRKRS